jgi:hypothetical protein
MKMPRQPGGFLVLLFKNMLDHDCPREGHRFRPEGHCFYCGKTRREVESSIASGQHQFDAIRHLDLKDDNDA